MKKNIYKLYSYNPKLPSFQSTCVGYFDGLKSLKTFCEGKLYYNKTTDEWWGDDSGTGRCYIAIKI